MSGGKLFLDIETLPAIEMPEADRRDLVKVPANYKDPEKIEEYIEKNWEKEWRKTALDPLKGSVWCVAAAFNDEDVETYTSVEYFLDHAIDADRMSEFPNWVAHSAQFDVHWIFVHAVLNRQDLVPWIPHAKFPARDWSDVPGIRYECTQELWQGPFRGDRPGLKDIAAYLGLEVPDMRGENVYDVWLEEPSKVVEYCVRDVELCREVYKRVTGWRAP